MCSNLSLYVRSSKQINNELSFQCIASDVHLQFPSFPPPPPPQIQQVEDDLKSQLQGIKKKPSSNIFIIHLIQSVYIIHIQGLKQSISSWTRNEKKKSNYMY